MAQVLTSQLVDDISGKISRTVFTKGRNGLNIRKQVRGTNPKSSYQISNRASLTARARAWVALSAANRTSWNAAAADFNKTSILGKKYKMTGASLYNMINTNLVFIGQAAVSTPPTFTTPTNLTAAAAASCTSAAQTLSFAPTPATAGQTLVVEATRPISAGRTSSKQSYRYFTTIAAAATSPANTFSAYQTKFGTPVTGKQIFFRITPVHNTSGLKGTPMLFSSVIS